MNKDITLKQVLDQLVAEEKLDPQRQDDRAETFANLNDMTEPDMPWYVRLFIGLSAWIAAALLIVFLGLAMVLESSTGSLISGLVFGTLALGLRRSLPHSIFVSQGALALSLAGQVLVTTGLAMEFEAVIPTALCLIVLELILIPLYPDALHRFFSTLIICSSIFAILLDLELFEAIHIFILVLALNIGWIWLNEARLAASRLGYLYRPLGYALAIAMFGVLCLSLDDFFDISWWVISALGLWAMLLGLTYYLLRAYGQPLNTPAALWLYGGLILLLFPAYQTPGLFAALLILALGFHRNNRLLMGLAVAFLIVFLIGYYYNLALTLLIKSYVLLGSGLILLIIRYFGLRSAA